ncbi:uncharacterized protein OCT59_027405 [Rhizophagus irregularis]|uniref:Kelch-like protein 17 n=2 Tax=Rhizophagus irregularis TaxID=588596 RepID=A0A015J6Q8_RHIIW|nr:hypothetical protein RirG_135350 [Rhizophagus irregularis DAOM 197198w]UZO07105.1 hypothetical protein OCT59_027405 [Rhizophagus irregularis]GBC45039.1 carbohydrate-binding module family 13 protein [Rhizophagus irregularis DAOM 181602=DAOM 197198]
MVNDILQKLSQNLLEILDDDEYYDITIEVGDDPHVKIFKAHMAILYFRSYYFRRVLSAYKKKNDGTLTHIKLPKILPETFQIILRYIYGGVVSLDEYDAPYIIKILVSASELNLQEFINILQSFLIENKSEWIELNFSDVYELSFENSSFSDLQKYCNDLISNDPDKIFRSLNYSATSEKVLISLIQSEKFQIKEIQVWEFILKCGLTRNPELPSDPKMFSDDDFNTLKNRIQQYVPFINFYNLTSEEFLNKVYPYKKILSEELFDKLIFHFMNPNKQSKQSEQSEETSIGKPEETKETNIDSNIITLKHAELILKWIDENNPGYLPLALTRWIYKDTTDIKEKFKLLLRGTRDGFTPEKFHEICDNQSHTLTIIKVQDSNEILGGYNPVAWKSDNSYGATKDSFIFSFKDNNNIENHILSRVKFEFELTATYNSVENGSSFSGSDLNLRDKIGSCSQRSYENKIRETADNFLVEEYEVFQIKRN